MKRIRRILLIVLACLLAIGTSALLITRLPPFGAAPSGERLARAQRSRHYARGHFTNLEPTHKLQPGMFGEMISRQFGDEQRVPPSALPIVRRSTADYAAGPPSAIRATWIGHASVLLELERSRILTDPVFSQRCSPFDFVGPERFAPPPIALGDLPEIHAVVISHDHYDHLDMATVTALARRGTQFFVPLGIGAHLERWGVPSAQISDLDWYESAELGGIRVTATPARHYSGRGLLDSDRTLWASWVIAAGEHRVFFSGDTGYSAEFRKIGERFGPFDLTLIKIGASDPTWHEIHMSPEDAVRTHQDVRGRVMLPVHWATFNLANHAWNEPAERALEAARSAGVRLVLPRPGEWVDPTQPAAVTTWWRY